jgi:Dyp-type peroxidase family
MINTHQKAIDQRDLNFNMLFENLQGNILKSHGRGNTHHIFLKFKPAEVESARGWIRKFAEEDITSCKTQLRETELYKRNGISGGIFFGFYLSAKGYQYFGHNTNQFSDESFRKGMVVAGLNDPPKINWESGFQEDIHAMVLIGDIEANRVGLAAKRIIAEVENFAEILTIEYGKAIRNANGDGLEHFGYVDGISQPLFFKEEVDANLSIHLTPLVFDPSAELDLVLVPDPFTTAEDAFGSYFVFRKLEQNVRGFKQAEEVLAKTLHLAEEGKERAGAMLVGRFEDGTPVTLAGEDGLIASGIMNNFDYSNDIEGAKCPFHAHIRKTNPRRSEDDKKHIMARRGITFGHRNVSTEIEPVTAQLPTGGVGLLFMSFQKSITNQFEVIQKHWSNDADFPPENGNVGIDPLIGQDGLGNISTGKFAKQHGVAASMETASFHHFITMKGGEYFFAPSLPFLRNSI